VANNRNGLRLQGDYRRIAERRGTKKARVAVVPRLLTLVFYGLRDRPVPAVPKRRGVSNLANDRCSKIGMASLVEARDVFEPVVAGSHHASAGPRRDARQRDGCLSHNPERTLVRTIVANRSQQKEHRARLADTRRSS
jgi:hypothetical protein